MTKNLNLLNCNNYHVSDLGTGDHWYAQNGLRSLYAYSKITNESFRTICDELLAYGQTVVTYKESHEFAGTRVSLTSI